MKWKQNESILLIDINLAIQFHETIVLMMYCDKYRRKKNIGHHFRFIFQQDICNVWYTCHLVNHCYDMDSFVPIVFLLIRKQVVRYANVYDIPCVYKLHWDSCVIRSNCLVRWKRWRKKQQHPTKYTRQLKDQHVYMCAQKYYMGAKVDRMNAILVVWEFKGWNIEEETVYCIVSHWSLLASLAKFSSFFFFTLSILL